MELNTGFLPNDRYWGEWDDCPGQSYVVKFQTKVESWQGHGDDSAVNAIKMTCSDGSTITSKEGPWGKWRDDESDECIAGFNKAKIKIMVYFLLPITLLLQNLSYTERAKKLRLAKIAATFRSISAAIEYLPSLQMYSVFLIALIAFRRLIIGGTRFHHKLKNWI